MGEVSYIPIPAEGEVVDQVKRQQVVENLARIGIAQLANRTVEYARGDVTYVGSLADLMTLDDPSRITANPAVFKVQATQLVLQYAKKQLGR